MSTSYENLSLGGHSLGESRYLFKNEFAGAKIRKRAEWQVLGAILLWLVGLGASMVTGTMLLKLELGGIMVICLGGMALLVFGMFWLKHRMKAEIGTFVCELITEQEGDQTVRRFECTSLRGEKPETVAKGTYRPEDLELRGVETSEDDSSLPWAEFRLNISDAQAPEPETIVLLGAPTAAHKLGHDLVITSAQAALATQRIEVQEITNNLS